MNRFKYVMLLVGMFTILSADTIPGGDVSGVWFADSSPYYIAGNIAVQANDTLTIEPGVLVNFLGVYTFSILGYLEAIGTETDSIAFTASTSWSGLHITNNPDTCRLEYCIFENFEYFLFSAILCINTNPIISHCRISNNESYSEGGGITLYGSGAEISHCTITGNAGAEGGGVLCDGGSTPTIFKCNITDNNLSGGGVYGGGIAIDGGSNPVIDSCIISDNFAVRGGGIAVLYGSSCTITDCWINADSVWGGGSGRNGGGIYINSSGGTVVISGTTVDDCYSFDHGAGLYIQNAASVSITRSIFDGNYSYGEGAVLYSVNCGLFIDHCDMVNNEASLWASGIALNGSTDMTLSNCIFRSQSYDVIYFENYSSASITYNDFYDWGYGPFLLNVPAGLGNLVQTNYNGDSCDIFNNIFLDPLFEDFPVGNYHLTDSSPCIDAGDPAFAFDPDSTITDIGVYWYDQRMPSITLSTTALDFGSVTVGQSADLGFVIYNVGDGNLRISDISNNLAVFAHDWNPLDSIVSPGDSLEVMVTFTPDDTTAFNDTCWIDNNDTLCYVALAGVGLPPGIAEGALAVPEAFALRQALPNPCKSFATIRFELPQASAATLSVYDVSGRLVSQLINNTCEAGFYEARLDASALSAGVYFCHLKAAGNTAIRKVIVTK